MPQAALVAGLSAGIPALASLGGAIMGNRANNRAQDAQERAAREAMAYQRQKDQQARDDYRFQYNAYRDQFYGGQGKQPTGGMVNTGVTFGSPGAVPAQAAAPQGAQPGAAAPLAGAPASPVVADPAAMPTGATTMADVGPWSASNYGRYLGRQR